MGLSLKFDQIFTFVSDLLSEMLVFHLKLITALLEFLQLFLYFLLLSFIFLDLPYALCLRFQSLSFLSYYSFPSFF